MYQRAAPHIFFQRTRFLTGGETLPKNEDVLASNLRDLIKGAITVLERSYTG